MTNSPFIIMERSGSRDALKSVPLSAVTPDMLFGGAQPDALTTAGAYQAVAWMYRCVQYRADGVAGIPWTLEGRAKNVDVKMLQQAIPDLLRRIEGSLCLDGGAYLFKVRNKVRLLDVRWLTFRSIQPQYDSAVGLPRPPGIAFKRNMGSAEPLPLTTDDVVYVWPADPLVEIGPGLPPAQVALRAAGIVASANEYAAQFFSRGGMNATLLVVDPTTSDADLRRLESWWKRLMAGVRQAWQTVAMRRNVDVKQLGYEPEKLAMPQLKAEARSEIVAAFGLSEDVVASNAANFATATAHKMTTIEQTLLPEAKIISAALNEQLFNPLGLELVWHPDQMEAMQQANALQADAIVKLYAAGLISREEARTQVGFTPVEENAPVVPSEGMTAETTGDGAPPPADTPPVRVLKAVASDGADAARRKIERAHTTPIARALNGQMDTALNGDVSDPKASRGA